jgi:hypothetical protein
VIVNVILSDVSTPGVTTLTATSPAAARSSALMVMRSRLPFTNVVGLAAPFQCTTDDAPKWRPLTVSVKPTPPTRARVRDRPLITGTAVLNVAVTVVAVFIVTAQVAVPPHAPLQPAKTEPDAAFAVSFVRVPGATASVQSLPHAIPARELFTVPEPVPFFVTDSVRAVPAVAEPLTPREMVSPLAVKFTLLAKLPALVG